MNKPFQAVRAQTSLGYYASAEEAALAYARCVAEEAREAARTRGASAIRRRRPRLAAAPFGLIHPSGLVTEIAFAPPPMPVMFPGQQYMVARDPGPQYIVAREAPQYAARDPSVSAFTEVRVPGELIA